MSEAGWGGGAAVAFCHRRVMLSILHICYQGWNEHLKFDTLLTGAKFSKQHRNQNGGEKKKQKKKTAVPARAQRSGQLNKSKVLFRVVFLAAPSHTLYIAFFTPHHGFFFYFCGIKGKKNPFGWSLG